MAVGALRTIVIDCLDPEPLARFWSFQILLDPAGNEFCLVHLPGSAGP